MVDPYSVVSLTIYPIKSCRGIDVKQTTLTASGFLHDREYMLVNERGKFLSQRELPQMAQIEITIEKDKRIKLSAPGMKSIIINTNYIKEYKDISIWEDKLKALVQEDDISEWFSSFLSYGCILVKQDNIYPRYITKKYAISYHNRVNFSDAYPVSLTTIESLNRLSKQIGRTIPMNRFRSNIVISGKYPFAEDFWGEIRIGNIKFVLVKPCYKCIIVNTNQITGKRDIEPIRTLTQTRRTEKGLPFGQYLIPKKYKGVINIGDKVEILKQK